MKKNTQLVLIVIAIISLVLMLFGGFFIQVPCGEMTTEGDLLDGTCQYGTLFFSNLRNRTIPSTLPLFIVSAFAIIFLIVLAIIVKRRK